MMNEVDFHTDDLTEARVVASALGLLAAIAEPAKAKVRVEQFVAATKEYAEQRAASERGLAEVSAKQAAVERAEAELTEKTSRFQLWVDQTEQSYRQREGRILQNEERHARRDRELDAREADINRRAAEHEALLRKIKEAV
jgi:hypothetical protein